MSVPHKIKRPSYITVGDFFRHDEAVLKLKLVGSDSGMARKIQEPSVNRPGLALSGFFDYFAFMRVQVLGNSELAYLKKLDADTRRSRFVALCAQDIPCIVVARGRNVPEDLVLIANAAGIRRG